MSDFHAQRHGGIHVAKFSLQMPCFSEFIRIFAPRMCCKESRPFLLPLHTCTCSTLIGNEADALLSCTLESGKFIIEQDGVRRFTYIRGLVVSLSFLCGNPEPECKDVGYAGPRSLYPYSITKRQHEYTPSMFVVGQHWYTAIFTNLTGVLKKTETKWRSVKTATSIYVFFCKLPHSYLCSKNAKI